LFSNKNKKKIKKHSHDNTEPIENNNRTISRRVLSQFRYRGELPTIADGGVTNGKEQ